MTPYDYVDCYHRLSVSDPRLGLDVTLDITKYRSGWFKEDVAEADIVLGRIGAKLKNPVKSAYGLPAPFCIEYDPRFDPTEHFVPMAVRRAFASRGSPEDIQDALRLAVAAGRTDQLGPKAYAEKWFGQDCNAFVGNYLGLSPLIGIAGYAKGFGRGKILGGGPDIEASRSYLPFPLVEDVDDIGTDDLLVSYGSEDPREGHGKNRFRHIALVHSFDGDASAARVQIAEWGTKGGSGVHKNRYNGPLVDDLSTWKPGGSAAAYGPVAAAFRAAFPKKKGVAFLGTDPNGEPALRVFFSGFGGNWPSFGERGYEVAGRSYL